MLIGICGDIGSGKDTVGDVLVKEFGFTRASFAERLKLWVFDLVEPLGVERRHIFGGSPETKQADQAELLTMLSQHQLTDEWGTDYAVEPWTGRSLLEYLGTEVGRGFHSDVWVRKLMAAYEQGGAGQRWVITDLRFPNEFDAIRAAGGHIWRTRLDVPHSFGRADGPCPVWSNWRDACECGSIRSTGHVSDEAWRHLPYDLRLSAPKPGVDILQSAARHAVTTLLQQESTR